jgi:hypothetical protein
MDAQLVIHFDSADGQEVWWAESPAVPGFSASADTLTELRLVIASLLPDLASDVGETVTFTTEWLADASTVVPGPGAAMEDDQPRHSVGGLEARVRVGAPAS